MTSKQRAYLKSLAQTMEPIFQIGKASLTPENTQAISEALAARELIKIRVLENSLYTSREAAEQLAESCGCEVVQVLGTRITLYKPNPQKPVIVLED